MKTIAIPCENGQVCPHFGHAPQFALYNVDPRSGQVHDERFIDAPPHQPGMRPGWLAQQGAHVVLAGGMGARAHEIFTQHGITVVTGIVADGPRAAVDAYVQGTLQSSGEMCDHNDQPCQ